MTQQPQQKNMAGPMLLLIVLLVDAGLAVWGWNMYQARQAQYSATGLNVAAAPKAPLKTINFAPRPSETPMADPARNIIKNPELAYGEKPAASSAKPAPSASGRSAPAAGGGASQARPETRRLVIRAKDIYFALKRDPRFKSSPVIQSWKREFLSYPDLNAVNKRYQDDKDPIRFLVDMAKSPNFAALLGRYIRTADVQEFISSMKASPVVAAAADGFLSDFNLKAAAQRLPIPGLSEAAAPQRRGNGR